MARLTPTATSLREQWKLYIAGVLIAVTAAITLYVAWVFSAANEVENLLDRAEGFDLGAIASGDEGAISEAQSLVEVSEQSVDSLSSRLGPVRIAGAVAGWVPWAGDQLRAPGLMTKRAEAALAATGPLVSAAEELTEFRSILTADSLLSEETLVRVDRLVNVLDASARATSDSMDAIREAAAEMDGVSLVGFLNSRETRITGLESRMLRFGDVLVSLPQALADTRDVAGAARALEADLGNIDQSFDFPRLAIDTVGLAMATRDAVVSLERLTGATNTATIEGELPDLLAELSLAVSALADMSSGLSVLAGTLSDSLSIIRESDRPLLSNGDELQRALGLLADRQEELRSASLRAADGVRALVSLGSSGSSRLIPAELASLLEENGEIFLSRSDLIHTAPSLLLNLIGSEGERTYLVLGQTSDELRAAGGFTSSAWTLTFDDGSLVDTRFIPILEFDDTRNLDTFPATPDPLRQYMDAGAFYLRDVGWSPNFPTVGRLASEMYALNGHGEVDGVISITQWGIIRLIEAIGGVEVDGEYIPSSQTLSVIEERTDDEGTGFLQTIFTGVVDSLKGDMPGAEQLRLLKAFGEIIEHKDLMLYSVDPARQRQAEALKMAGRFPLNDRDRLGVVDSNVGWSKSDRSIVRSAEYSVDLSNPANATAELTLSYENTGRRIGRDCDSHGPPPAPFDGYDVSKNSCYWNYLRVYIPLGADPISTPAFPLPANSVPVVLGTTAAGSPTLVHSFDELGDHFAGLFNVAPGRVATFAFSYGLPPGTVKGVDGGLSYELDLFAQPGARGRSVTLSIALPGDQVIVQSSHSPSEIDGGRVQFRIDLTSDQLFSLQTAPA